MLGQFIFPVLFDHFPDLVHPFDNKHLDVSKFIFFSISIFIQQGIVSCIKGVYRIQKSGKVIMMLPRHI